MSKCFFKKENQKRKKEKTKQKPTKMKKKKNRTSAVWSRGRPCPNRVASFSSSSVVVAWFVYPFSAFVLEKVSFKTFSKTREDYECSGWSFKRCVITKLELWDPFTFRMDANVVVELSCKAACWPLW